MGKLQEKAYSYNLEVENIELIRKLVLIDGLSQNEVAERLGHSKRSVKRALVNSEPRQYTLSVPRTAYRKRTHGMVGWSGSRCRVRAKGGSPTRLDCSL
jgi:DNA invertase Pin-like site-specific DNA recombinase